jgi:hypothetical protein
VRPGLRLVDRYKVRAWGPLGPGGPRTVAVTWAAGVEGHGAGGLVSQATRLGLLLVLPSSPVSLPPPLGRGPDRQGGREAASPSSGHWALPSAGGTAPSQGPSFFPQDVRQLGPFLFSVLGFELRTLYLLGRRSTP